MSRIQDFLKASLESAKPEDENTNTPEGAVEDAASTEEANTDSANAETEEASTEEASADTDGEESDDNAEEPSSEDANSESDSEAESDNASTEDNATDEEGEEESASTESDDNQEEEFSLENLEEDLGELLALEQEYRDLEEDHAVLSEGIEEFAALLDLTDSCESLDPLSHALLQEKVNAVAGKIGMPESELPALESEDVLNVSAEAITEKVAKVIDAGKKVAKAAAEKLRKLAKKILEKVNSYVNSKKIDGLIERLKDSDDAIYTADIVVPKGVAVMLTTKKGVSTLTDAMSDVKEFVEELIEMQNNVHDACEEVFEKDFSQKELSQDDVKGLHAKLNDPRSKFVEKFGDTPIMPLLTVEGEGSGFRVVVESRTKVNSDIPEENNKISVSSKEQYIEMLKDMREFLGTFSKEDVLEVTALRSLSNNIAIDDLAKVEGLSGLTYMQRRQIMNSMNANFKNPIVPISTFIAGLPNIVDGLLRSVMVVIVSAAKDAAKKAA